MADTADIILTNFVIDLVIDDAFRSRFQNPANREAMMQEAGLRNEAKDAIRQASVKDLKRLLNTQVMGAVKAKQPKKAKSAKAGKKTASKARKKR